MAQKKAKKSGQKPFFPHAERLNSKPGKKKASKKG